MKPVSQNQPEDQERPQNLKNFLRYYKSQWRSLFDSHSLFLKEDSHYLPLCYVRIVAYKPLRSIEKLNSKFNRRPTSTFTLLHVAKRNPSDDDLSIYRSYLNNYIVACFCQYPSAPRKVWQVYISEKFGENAWQILVNQPLPTLAKRVISIIVSSAARDTNTAQEKSLKIDAQKSWFQDGRCYSLGTEC